MRFHLKYRNCIRISPTKIMPTPLYARYRPPAAPKPAAANSDPPATSTAPKAPGTPSMTVKEKKKRSRVDRSGEKSSNPVEGDNKRSKKRKRTPIEQEPNLDERNDGLSKRHGAILAKYQRSSKISEKVRESQPSPIVEEDDQKEPTPELHGNSVCTSIFIMKRESNWCTKT
jgi:hypothetical protein